MLEYFFEETIEAEILDWAMDTMTPNEINALTRDEIAIKYWEAHLDNTSVHTDSFSVINDFDDVEALDDLVSIHGGQPYDES
tara:strand:- start:361 stop:606 length:246 start_codon:yes stop_codon:yes gene_type:complete